MSSRRYRQIISTLLFVTTLCAGGSRSPAQVCTGDCDGNGRVTVDELTFGVRLALIVQSPTACASLDADEDGNVSIAELVRAVNNALGECPSRPSPTPTSTPTPTPTESTPTATPEPRALQLSGPFAPSSLFQMGSQVFFSAVTSPEIPFASVGLWKSDGTQDGTLLLLPDLGQDYTWFAERNGALFFVANIFELWTSDGTPEGTRAVFVSNDLPQDLINVGGTLFFASGGELWKSDGTEDGTVLVASFPDSPTYLTAIGDTLFFVVDDGTTGTELWKSDGTAEGTSRVRDIRPGEDGSSPSALTNVNGTLFFFADYGIAGDELWRSDGTQDGTQLVKDIVPGPDTSFPRFVTVFDERFFFFANDDAHGSELWQSDGTVSGTTMVADLAPGPASSDRDNFFRFPTRAAVALDGALYFEALGALWKTDGTPQGTSLVYNVDPTCGQGECGIAGLGVFDNRVVFEGIDPARGGNVWVSDGTSAGTYPAIDTPHRCAEPANIPGFLYAGPNAERCTFGFCVFGENGLEARWFFDLGSRLLFVTANKIYSAAAGDLSTPTINTCLPKPRSDRLETQVYVSETNKVYIALWPRIEAGNGEAIQVTSVAISRGEVRSVNEHLTGADAVLTSVSGTTEGLIPPREIKRTVIARGVSSADDISFDLTGDGVIGFGGTPKFLTWNGGQGGNFAARCNEEDVTCLALCDVALPASTVCATPADVPTGDFATVERTSFDASAVLDTMVFPNPGGPLMLSEGARCSTTQLSCDPANLMPRACFGGRCDVLGGERSAQNVTLDDTVRSLIGNRESPESAAPVDGFRLESGDVIIFALDAGGQAPPLQVAASGFLLDKDDRVLDAVGP